MTQKARRLTRISFLGAMGTILMLSVQIPFPWAPFLKYDPGNIPALMATFLFGPLEGIAVVFLKCVLFLALRPDLQELIGVPLNFIAGAALVGVSGWIYQIRKTRSTAALALTIGVLVSSLLMVAANFAVYPLFCRLLFQRVPGASELSAVLWSAVFPFNLGKGFLDSFLVFLVYKKLGGLLKN